MDRCIHGTCAREKVLKTIEIGCMQGEGVSLSKEGRKEDKEARKEGNKQGRKEGNKQARKEGRKGGRKQARKVR